MNLDPECEEFVDTADYSNEDFRNKKQQFRFRYNSSFPRNASGVFFAMPLIIS